MRHSERTIVIVGAGFSGTVLAANLLRRSPAGLLRVVLLEREDIGRGIAYAEHEYPYLLNVPAGRMSARSSDPHDFLNFAKRRYPSASAEDFLPRRLYGEYLQELLTCAEALAPAGVRLERLTGTARHIEHTREVKPHRIVLCDGRTLHADEVVLAVGNPPPAHPPGTQALLGSPCYGENPWSAANPWRPGEVVLVVGTGLTMADAVLAGMASVDGRARIHALSRHGLIPCSQGFAPGLAAVAAQPRDLLRAGASTRRLFRAVREMCRDLERRGGNWQEAIACVRNLAPELWRRLPLRERRRFLRHARAYWDIHRHRLPPHTLAQLDELRRLRKLTVHAGRILGCERIGTQVRVSWRPRGERTTDTLLVDRIINCTGPDYDARRSHDPLLRSLVDQGMAVPDALGLGLRTAALGALVDARGRAQRTLYCIGPLLRADHWEATAVQELRGHAERLARHLAGRPESVSAFAAALA